MRSSWSSIHTSWYELHITPVNMFVCAALQAIQRLVEPLGVAGHAGHRAGEAVERRPRGLVQRDEPVDHLTVVCGVAVVVLLIVRASASRCRAA